MCGFHGNLNRVDFSTKIEERRKRELLYKAERKKQRQQVEVAEKKTKEEYKQQKELRSYSYVALSCAQHLRDGGMLTLLRSVRLCVY